MFISDASGLIAAGSIRDAQPMLRLGSLPVITRLVISFRQAGLFPIVVITGAESLEVRYQLAGMGVVFLPNNQPEQPQLFESVKIGLRYLKGKSNRVFFAPVNAPMCTLDTLDQLGAVDGDVVTPSYHEKGGHPVVIADRVIDEILSYQGEDGLRGAVRTMGDRRIWVPVKDPGVVMSVHNEGQLEAYLPQHNRQLLHPDVQVSIGRERPFFDARLKLLLFLLSDTGHMKTACQLMALSIGKGWKMVNDLEAELGYPVVERRQGGNQGGSTRLTEEGKRFLLATQRYEEAMIRYARRQFRAEFLDSGLFPQVLPTKHLPQ
jgi:molybdate transport repressor ModE-like protein